MGLRLDGAVDVDATGQVQAAGTLHKAGTDLDRTIQRAIAGRAPTLANITRSKRVRGAVDRLRQDLAGQGLVPGPAERRLLGITTWAAVRAATAGTGAVAAVVVMAEAGAAVAAEVAVADAVHE